ncbi:MAG: hypothetical protein JSU63_21900, partial [Phycisphaerales bacterium]
LVVHDGGLITLIGVDGDAPVSWQVGGDLEGVCVADVSSDFIYVAVEQPDSILEFNLSTGEVTRTFDLSNVLQGPSNAGLEALTFVPVADHPEGGLFYAGLQCDGKIYVFELPIVTSATDTSVVHVNTITPVAGRTDMSGLHYNTGNGVLYAIFDSSNRLVALDVAGTCLAEWDIPGNQQEGLAAFGCFLFVADDVGPAVWRYVFPFAQEDTDDDGVDNCMDLCDGFDDKVDADGDDVPDDCDNCELSNPDQNDCQPNGIGDTCDLASETSNDCDYNEYPDECDIADEPSRDSNLDGVLDECQLAVLPPQVTSGEDSARKNRYISVDPSSNGATPVAMRVTLSSMRRCGDSLDKSCSSDSDCAMAAGLCIEHPDVGTILGWVSAPNANAVSRVVGTPVFRVWPETTLHVGDCEVVPVATYQVQTTPDGALFSGPLEVGTILKPHVLWHYGDTVGIGTGALPPEPGFTPPDGIVNITDVSAYVLTAEGRTKPNAPTTWVDLHGVGDGAPPNFILNVSDLQRILFGSEGQQYTDTPGQLNPADCP